MPTLYVTAPPAEGEALARGLVDAELAACVNRIDCRSVYRWEDEVHDDEEVLLLVKTTADGADQCVEWLRAHHPYDVPCIERFEEADVLEDFAQWRADVVETGASAE